MTDYSKVDQVKNIIQDLLDRMGVSASVEFEESLLKGLVFNISSRESRLLIGHQGGTLHSLEILAHAMAARALPAGDPFYFTLDVDDYKRKREYFLKEQARDVATEVKRSGNSVALEPMPNYERRYVHAYLQENHPEVTTFSEGREPYRKIVVKLKAE
jgi:spoIIIJ-associated protein